MPLCYPSLVHRAHRLYCEWVRVCRTVQGAFQLMEVDLVLLLFAALTFFFLASFLLALIKPVEPPSGLALMK